MDDIIHAMGALNLFASNAMGAMDVVTNTHAKRIVCTPLTKAIPYMLQLQYLNHLGTVSLTPYSNLRLMEPLVHHHRLLNYSQSRFGWKSMPYPMGLRTSPMHFVHSMRSENCDMRVHYIDDAQCRTRTATHVIYMSRHRVYVKMQQKGPLRYHARVTSPNYGITLSRSAHQSATGIGTYKTTVLRVLATRTPSDQSMTRTWLCFYSTVVVHLPFDRGPGPR